jgi:hypothetical protein
MLSFIQLAVLQICIELQSDCSALQSLGYLKVWEILLWSAKKKSPWPEPASELYRPSDSGSSEKLVPTFVDRGVSRSQRGGFSTAVTSVL